jgi:DNA excision repair protein ERCC-4
MQYADSTESHRYAKSVEYEKAVFTQLLRTNTKLVVSLPDDQTELERDRRSEVIYAADPRTLEVVESSNSRKKARTDAARIVVDVRELRSSLPNILHSQGIQLCPVTLAVGDFILSPTICVERKVSS